MNNELVPSTLKKDSMENAVKESTAYSIIHAICSVTYVSLLLCGIATGKLMNNELVPSTLKKDSMENAVKESTAYSIIHAICSVTYVGLLLCGSVSLLLSLTFTTCVGAVLVTYLPTPNNNFPGSEYQLPCFCPYVPELLVP